ncbi:septum formation initiator, partial [Kitasatospora sp. NPDC007106]
MSTPTTDSRPADRPAHAGPLIITADDALADHLARICAAAGAEPQLARAEPPRALWEDAPLVLVGDDLAES